MGGQSDRDKEAQNVQAGLKNYNYRIGQIDPNVANRWENWNPEFGYGDMSKILDQLTKGQMGEVNKQTNLGIQQGQSDLAERQASQGIASSSIKESGNRAITNDANRNRSSLLQQLFQQNQQGKLGAMGEANKYGFMGNQQAQNVDLANIQNLMQKYGLMGQGYGMQMNNLQNISDDTWLTDVFSGFNALSGFAGPLAGLFSSSKAAQGGG